MSKGPLIRHLVRAHYYAKLGERQLKPEVTVVDGHLVLTVTLAGTLASKVYLSCHRLEDEDHVRRLEIFRRMVNDAWQEHIIDDQLCEFDFPAHIKEDTWAARDADGKWRYHTEKPTRGSISWQSNGSSESVDNYFTESVDWPDTPWELSCICKRDYYTESVGTR